MNYREKKFLLSSKSLVTVNLAFTCQFFRITAYQFEFSSSTISEPTSDQGKSRPTTYTFLLRVAALVLLLQSGVARAGSLLARVMIEIVVVEFEVAVDLTQCWMLNYWFRTQLTIFNLKLRIYFYVKS